MMIVPELPNALIRIYSRKYDIPYELILAIIECESNGDRYAVRSELQRDSISPNFKYLVDVAYYAKKNKISRLTEEVLQRMSFGYMQVMGYTARWQGFTGNLMKMVEPSNSIEIGCKYIDYQMRRYDRDFKKAIAAYNAGTAIVRDDKFVNQAYVNKVWKSYQKYLKL